MPLSEDLVLMEAFVSVVAAGGHEMTPEGARELQLLLAHAAEQAAELEVALEHARRLPRNDPATSEARAAGLASGKVVRLADRRVSRLPEVAEPGWIA